MRIKRRQADLPPIELPERSDVVSLTRPSGGRLPARIAERGPDTLLVLVMLPTEPLTPDQLEGLVLEFASARGRVRLRGTVTVEDRDLLRFSDIHSVQVLQEREYVRVKATRPVLVYSGRSRAQIQSFSVDVSGGGLLLAGPDTLKIGEEVRFRMTLTPGSEPVIGTGTVVRSDLRGHRAISFDSMTDVDRRRLVRFIFECQRAERRRGLDLEGGRHGS